MFIAKGGNANEVNDKVLPEPLSDISGSCVIVVQVFLKGNFSNNSNQIRRKMR
jgi:hypothetical protein